MAWESSSVRGSAVPRPIVVDIVVASSAQSTEWMRWSFGDTFSPQLPSRGSGADQPLFLLPFFKILLNFTVVAGIAVSNALAVAAAGVEFVPLAAEAVADELV